VHRGIRIRRANGEQEAQKRSGPETAPGHTRTTTRARRRPRLEVLAECVGYRPFQMPIALCTVCRNSIDPKGPSDNWTNA